MFQLPQYECSTITRYYMDVTCILLYMKHLTLYPGRGEKSSGPLHVVDHIAMERVPGFSIINIG